MSSELIVWFLMVKKWTWLAAVSLKDLGLPGDGGLLPGEPPDEPPRER